MFRRIQLDSDKGQLVQYYTSLHKDKCWQIWEHFDKWCMTAKRLMHRKFEQFALPVSSCVDIKKKRQLILLDVVYCLDRALAWVALERCDSVLMDGVCHLTWESKWVSLGINHPEIARLYFFFFFYVSSEVCSMLTVYRRFQYVVLREHGHNTGIVLT